MDCAKAISFGFSQGDVWDFYSGKASIEKAMPVIAIPTLAAAGAEVSWSAVISNIGEKSKIGLRCEKIRPVSAILDPQYTFSAPLFHTACGVADITSHSKHISATTARPSRTASARLSSGPVSKAGAR